MYEAIFYSGIRRYLLPLWLVATFAFSLIGQSPDNLEWEYFGPEQGMGMGFLDIIQDHQGFIWLGSTNGLYRYDGYQIKSFKKYSNKPSGLSSDFIWDLEEDEEGHIWMATYNGGANKWDRSSGRFSHFLHQPGAPESLAGDNVLKILSDKMGSLWVVVKNSNGVPVLDRLSLSTGEAIHYRSDSNDPYSLSCDTVSIQALQSLQFNPLYLGPKGDVWVGTENGLNLYLRESNRFRRFIHEAGNPNSLAFKKVLSIEASRKHEDVYWVRTATTGLEKIALDRLNIKTGIVERVSFGRDNGLDYNCLGFSLSEGEESAWISDFSLFQFKGDSLTVQKNIGLENGGNDPSLRVGLFQHSSGQLLLSPLGANPLYITKGGENMESPEGVFFLGPQIQEPFFIAQNPANPSLPFLEVCSIMEDRSGIIWIGSGGFYKLKVESKERVNKPAFENYYREEPGQAGLSSTAIRDVFEESPEVFWLATYQGGLNRLDRRSKKITHFLHNPLDPNSIGANTSYALWHDTKTNELWIGHDGGIDILSLGGKLGGGLSGVVFRHLKHASGWLDRQVNEIEPDGKGNLWIGTAKDGLLLYNPGTGNIIQQLAFTEPNPDPAHSSFINKVFIDSKENTWVAPGMGGLCRLAQKGASFQYECFLDGLFITDIFEASNGMIWCAAMNYGLIKFNPINGAYELVNMENRLARNSVLGIEEDRLGRIWFTSIGLTRYDPEEDTYRAYGKEDGIIGLDPERCLFKAKSGELFYSSAYGALQIFAPERVIDNPITPRPVLTDFKLFNESQIAGEDGPLKENIEVASEIHLTHYQHSFSFEFAGLEYADPGEKQYRYQLVGIDKGWIYSGAHREARYNSVRPGKYLFKVQAANSDGVWSEEPATVQIIIAPPWWSRWWAYILFTAFFLAPIFMVYRYQLKRKVALAEAKRLKEVDQLKTRLYTNITHEFRTPLTVILGMAEQMGRQPERWFREGLSMITRNAQSLLNLVNQMLDLRKIESGVMAVDKKRGDVINYLRYITESFHSFAESKRIGLHFLSQLEELHMDYDEDKLLKILSNLLSNAIKYTPKGGNVYVMVDSNNRKDKEFLEIRVKDTGIGIPLEKQARIFDHFYQVDDSATRKGEGVGVGLALARELVKLLEGVIAVKSQPGKGSEFIVELPISRLASEKHTFQEEKVEQVAGQFVLADSVVTEEELLLNGDCQGKPIALVIEDNRDVVRYLQTCLEVDYCVKAAYNGKAGIEKALEIVPDVIISDVMMPEKDGFEVTDTLKKDERTSHIPIILLTARATIEDRIIGLEKGADAYLSKPFNRDELRVRMEKMIELRKRIQERYAHLRLFPESADPALEIEDNFVRKVREMVEAHLDDPEFSIENISDSIFLSRTQVHRKLKALTGMPTGHFIHSVRLRHALHLLQTTDKSVTEVAMDVGFKDLAYFSRVFAAEFGKAPSEMRG